MLHIQKPLKHWVFWMFISEYFSKVIKIYNGFIFLIFWIMWFKVCLAIYSTGKRDDNNWNVEGKRPVFANTISISVSCKTDE
jgi:hypothetical protein